ncbi:MAG: uroporphyrinogen-III synthase [Coriobacteriia bacterium]|nr:uroporphyrinogen-III synthase [Coriobacteriia bacterium]
MSIADKTIVLTRTLSQSASITDALMAAGARVVSFPTIELLPPPDSSIVRRAIADITRFDWIVFTSANAVSCFFDYLRQYGNCQNSIVQQKTAVVGPATAQALVQHGVSPDLIADSYQAEGIIAAFQQLRDQQQQKRGSRILIPRALEARELLPKELTQMGFDVTVAPVYQSAMPCLAADAFVQLDGADGIAFTAPSTARNFATLLQEAGMDVLCYLNTRKVFSIGSITTEELKDLGVSQTQLVQATQATTESLVEAITAAF